MLLILHDPDKSKSYWTDALQALRIPAGEKDRSIEVPRANLLEATNPVTLFENAGVVDLPFIPSIEEVLRQLVTTVSSSGSFPLSYFDLFTHGLTNICRSLYYGMDLIQDAVAFNLDARRSEFGMGMGEPEHRFAFGFVQFLLAQNLAQIDYADCLIDWVDREMHPHFVAPLTSRGRALVALIHKEEARLTARGTMQDGGLLHVAQEGFFQMVIMSYIGRIRGDQAVSGCVGGQRRRGD